MAKLTEAQLKIMAKREFQKNEAIQKKMTVQKKKEQYGENWKKAEQDKLQSELELEIGNQTAPKIYDSGDLYEYFDPIQFYKDSEYKNLNMDYENFLQTEEKYKDAIDRLDREIEKFEDSNYIPDSDKESNIKKDKIENTDGTSPEDKVLPITKDSESIAVEDKVVELAKANTEIAQSKANIHFTISRFFNRFVPLFNKHVCTCCGRALSLDQYYITQDLTNATRVDNNGNLHLRICKNCCQKLFMYFYDQVADGDAELALQYFCSALNIYWDEDFFFIAKKEYEDSGRKGTFIGEYIKQINKNMPGLTFKDSPFLEEKYEKSGNIYGIGYSNQEEQIGGETPLTWSQEDYKNRKTVIKIAGYDPFECESDENKKILYRDLLNILDEGMENDFVKFQSGISIVRSFFKIRQLDKRQKELEENGASLKDQKDLAAIKASELKAITDFARDNGFSERYATAKAKGENTMTGILNKMNEAKFEKAVVNKYDIETSATIQQAADASFKAIFNQLGMSDADVYKTAQRQYEELVNIRKKLNKTEEDLRIAKYKLAQKDLEEKERKYLEAKEGKVQDE